VSFSYFARKLFRLLLTVWAAATLVFIMLRLAGDPVAAMVPSDAPQIVIDRYRERFGLDQPFIFQYLSYLGGLLHGDFGISFRTGGPAWDLVAPRIVPTLILTGTATLIAICLGVPAGLMAAANRNSWVDRLVMSFSVFGFAMPNFFLGILMILLFTLNLRWLPSGGFDHPIGLLMPAVALGLASSGAYARLTRSAVLEVLSSPFMRTAKANGIPPLRRMTHHVLRATLVPLVTLAGFSIGHLIAGAVVTETVFAWPGIGRLLVTSVTERDLAVVQLIVILAAATMATSNMIVDLLYGWLDPRIGTRRQSGAVRS
jgi:peptide/nickel transport system permease protein